MLDDLPDSTSFLVCFHVQDGTSGIRLDTNTFPVAAGAAIASVLFMHVNGPTAQHPFTGEG